MSELLIALLCMMKFIGIEEEPLESDRWTITNNAHQRLPLKVFQVEEDSRQEKS